MQQNYQNPTDSGQFIYISNTEKLRNTGNNSKLLAHISNNMRAVSLLLTPLTRIVNEPITFHGLLRFLCLTLTIFRPDLSPPPPEPNEKLLLPPNS